MVGFRKYGHNEVDEPGFTQPQMYEVIRSLKSLPELYGERLVEEGVIPQAELDGLVSQIWGHFESEY